MRTLYRCDQVWPTRDQFDIKRRSNLARLLILWFLVIFSEFLIIRGRPSDQIFGYFFCGLFPSRLLKFLDLWEICEILEPSGRYFCYYNRNIVRSVIWSECGPHVGAVRFGWEVGCIVCSQIWWLRTRFNSSGFRSDSVSFSCLYMLDLHAAFETLSFEATRNSVRLIRCRTEFCHSACCCFVKICLR